MSQIKDLIFTRTTSADNDWLVLQDSENNQTYKIKRSDFLAGLSGGNGGSNTTVEDEMRTVISRDANWILSTRANSFPERSTLCWTSMNTSESETGTLKIGYFTAKTKIHCMFAGGGANNGNLKLIKIRTKANNTVLFDSNLAGLLGTNEDSPKYCIINTSSFAGEECYFELTDSDTGNSWSWMTFVPQIFVE